MARFVVLLFGVGCGCLHANRCLVGVFFCRHWCSSDLVPVSVRRAVSVVSALVDLASAMLVLMSLQHLLILFVCCDAASVSDVVSAFASPMSLQLQTGFLSYSYYP